jgi:hypothetical protein
MGNKNHKKAIESLEKIRLELNKENPDFGLINHWKKEIKAFEKGIQQALKRLERLK